MLKSLAKRLLSQTGYRVVHGRRRWGVEVIDDAVRVLGGRGRLKVVFDVGANFGQSSLAYASAFPKATIHALEPVSSTFDKLSDRVESIRRIRPHRLALGASAGEMTITLYGDQGKSSLKDSLADSARGGVSGSEQVEVRTLDEFVSTEGIEHVSLLKTDTEGCDLNVMQGASESLKGQRIDLVYCEFHHYFDTPGGHPDGLGTLEGLNGFLADHGYRLLTTYTDAINPTEDLGTYNALFVAKSLQPAFRS
ncbi:MAG: FkbM family methyltransferase [Planctomycetota bacterium]